MDPTVDALLRSWSIQLEVIAPLLVTAIVYSIGWQEYNRLGSRRFPPYRLAAFLGGLIALFLALQSPIEPAADLLLFAHMVQHLLLMMIAPPLLLLGAPVLPLLRGLPIGVRRYWIAPLFRSRALRSVFSFLSHPVTAWCLFSLSTWVWHTPFLYERTLASRNWHYLEHASFFGTALLFWWPVIQPYPSRARWPRWMMIPYLLLADVQNTVLSAILCFSERSLYPHYAAVPRLWGISSLEDQRAAGVLMWVPGSLVFLLPVAVIGARLLFGSRTFERRVPALPSRNAVYPSLPILSTQSLPSPSIAKIHRRDVLNVPGLGLLLRWRYTRPLIQTVMLLLAVIVVLDGFSGPAVAPMNLAGVLPWTHWRGLVVLALLFAGNLFCYACPFTLPRRIMSRFLPAGQSWPRRLRSKWLAIGLLCVFFWAYEVFALWAEPAWTAAIIVTYFFAAFAVDAWFQAGSFCKYVCPIGQFHFVQSLVSPLEVAVRDPSVCHTCVTKDCIRGNASTPGCELGLFQPRKIGNLDCTFCMDCVHACPKENVGILPVVPGSTLLVERWLSGIGYWTQRKDILALICLLVFAAFANAAGMVGPIVDQLFHAQHAWGLHSMVLPITILFVGIVIAFPALVIPSAAVWTRWFGGTADTVGRHILALVPLGASMWLVHFAFHFFTSYGTWLPVTERIFHDLGWRTPEPTWECGCCSAAPPWLIRLEILSLELGLLASLYLGYRASKDLTSKPRWAPIAFIPWGLLTVLLFVFGIWILFQPMEMRGTMLAS